MIYAWDETPAAVTSEMATTIDDLRAQNKKLADVTPRRGIFTSEFLLHVGGLIAVGVTAAQGQIAEMAEHLGPKGAALVNIAVAIVIASAGGTYAANRRAMKDAEAEAKKQITDKRE